MYNRKGVLFRAVLAGAAGVLIGGCGKPAKEAAPMQMPPAVVTVAPVQEQELVEWEEFTGRVAPVDFVEVRARVSGHIEAVKFQSGQLVKKGDPLFEVDARWHKAEVDRRAAELEQAKVRVANAEREANRTEQLVANRAMSREEADQRVARHEEAKASLLAAEAGLNAAKLDLEYTVVRAPINGRVSRALVTEGNFVTGGNGMSSVPLTTIVSIDPVHVYADVDENSLLRFNGLMRDGKLGANGNVPVELQLADESGFPHKGVIESFDNKLDPQSGSILLRAQFPNQDGRILPGLFARIRLPASDRRPTVLIEEAAIGTDQAQKFVLTLTSSNTVAYRPVKLGPTVEGKRVVREGLQPGDQVVVNGLARVRPGMPVQPQAPGQETTGQKTVASR